MRSRGGTPVSLPLEGIRVLDLSRLLPGGFCSLLLADFGADVLKVEDTGMGDYIRWSPPYYEGAHESARSALFLALNRNKRSIRVDLKQERGREVLLRLVREYDVVLEAFPPGVLEGPGAGQFVDVSMADGSLAWLAMVAASYFADGVVPHRGELPLAGALICYRPYECADGWVSLGALEPKFWQAFCRGVGREDLIERQFERPGSRAHAQVVEIFAGRTRAEWEAFAAQHDCCLEPVLELDEALDSALVRAREMVVEISQPGAEQPVRQLGVPIKLSRTPGAHERLPGPRLGEHTEQGLSEAGDSEAQ